MENIRSLVTCSIILLAVIITGTPQRVFSQDQVTIAGQDVSLRLGLTLQPRFTYALADDDINESERIGFGVRRFRFRTYAGVGDNFRLFAQLEGSGTSAQVLDLRAEYRLAPHLWVRAGRFVGAQPRAMAITLHSEIDMVDRAAIADYWARNTLGADARDYGVEFLYKPAKTEYRLFLHNGDNRNNFKSGPADPNVTDNINDKGMAVSTSVRHFPNNDVNTEFGIYGSLNTSRNAYTRHPLLPNIGREYLSGAIHGYRGTLAGHFPLRLKFDAIMTQYETITVDDSEIDQLFAGATLFAGYLIRPDFEIMGRLESFDQDLNTSDMTVNMYSAGFTYSFSAARNQNFLGQKITAVYTYKDDLQLQKKSHIVIIQLQILL